jgi:primosomal protein N' (replication factor Y)
MTQEIKEGGQVILLLNRRGFSTHIQCPACGEVVRCPNCEIALTHHRDVEKAVCHYCDHRVDTPASCPDCHFGGIRFGGFGTQRLEAEVKATFPDATCLRMDSDTMRRAGSHEDALDQFRLGKIQILLGTQMIAKGLDFPNVTLVGVINADTALHFPDFRAAERTFQLVTQVAGRTGRGDRGGYVLVQTFSPDNAAIRAAANHDFAAFADYELPIRREFRYPPYSAVVRFVFRGSSAELVAAFAEGIAEKLRMRTQSLVPTPRILGPAPAPIEKLRGKFRIHLLIQAENQADINPILHELRSEHAAHNEIEWIVDVDALSML